HARRDDRGHWLAAPHHPRRADRPAEERPYHREGQTRGYDLLPHHHGGMIVAGVDHALQEIASMSRTEIQDRWAKLTGRPVPKLSIAMLRLALGYEIQARAKGGLSRATRLQLDGSDNTRLRAMPLAPGLRLVREWQ